MARILHMGRRERVRAGEEPGDGASRRARRLGLRRGAVLMLVTSQLCVMPGWLAGGALADGPSEVGPTVEPALEPQPAVPPTGEESEVEGQPKEDETTPPDGPTAETPGAPSPERDPEVPAKAPAPPTGGAPPTPPVETAEAAAGAAASGPSTPVAAANAQSVGSLSGGPGAVGANASSQRRLATSEQASSPGSERPRGARHGSRRRRTPAKSQTAAPTPEELVAAPVFAGLPPGLIGLEADQPPPYLIPIYKQAGRHYDVPWRVLAAINGIETDYGQNLSVSSAGAVGWMQFMPATWQEWGVDADHDGQANPYSPQDAIFAAARYLQASGAAHDLPGAIFAYNHADWYVAEVLLRARMLGDTATFARVEKGYSLPLDARYMKQLGRTDDGVDIETPPDGALVYSITPGVVSAVASDPAGFGPDYPVIAANDGALAGQYIYYGHVAQALVQPGQPVAAGQPIAIVGHTGDAASLGHGHIEIGFSDAAGAPLNQHGAEAWTPAGSVMRAFLVGLSESFGIASE
jgi:murein DD-endopeptidase MepM/ murein hydrolase activator NlpD